MSPDAAPGPETDRDLAESALSRRKREDAALILPLTGVALLASPVLDLLGPGTVLGLPSAYVFVIAVWVGLILLTRSLARRLVAGGDPGAD